MNINKQRSSLTSKGPYNNAVCADPASLVLGAGLGFCWGCLWAAQRRRWAAKSKRRNHYVSENGQDQRKTRMEYDEIAKYCESLGYRDKLRLSQLLIQLARKEEEIQNPQTRKNLKETTITEIANEQIDDINSIQYVIDHLAKLRPSKKKTILNSIRVMYQF
jgi:hypothetical protein